MTDIFVTRQFIQSFSGLTALTLGLLITASPGYTDPLPPSPGSQRTSAIQNNPFPPPWVDVDAAETSTPRHEAYTLGAGDRLRLDFFNIPEYSGETQVLADGALNLPLVGVLSVRGMTLGEAAEAITLSYSRLLRNPIVTVYLVEPRPLRVSIAGEVNRPGSYAMSLTAEVGETAEPQWPTVTQLIQRAGGITQQADVSGIRIERMQHNGEKQEIQVNLWQLLRQADLSQDITLRDGDKITISTANALTPAEVTQLSTASFAPDTIQVSVVGEVIDPGIVEVLPNTPLNQALLAAGGFDKRRARTSRVELIRLNPDGTVTQRSVAIDFAQGMNESSNPMLHNNDVVVVGRSGSASFSDAMDGVLGTLGRILPFFSLF